MRDFWSRWSFREFIPKAVDPLSIGRGRCWVLVLKQGFLGLFKSTLSFRVLKLAYRGLIGFWTHFESTLRTIFFWPFVFDRHRAVLLIVLFYCYRFSHKLAIIGFWQGTQVILRFYDGFFPVLKLRLDDWVLREVVLLGISLYTVPALCRDVYLGIASDAAAGLMRVRRMMRTVWPVRYSAHFQIDLSHLVFVPEILEIGWDLLIHLRESGHCFWSIMTVVEGLAGVEMRRCGGCWEGGLVVDWSVLSLSELAVGELFWNWIEDHADCYILLYRICNKNHERTKTEIRSRASENTKSRWGSFTDMAEETDIEG